MPHRLAKTQSHPKRGTGTRRGCGQLAEGAWHLCGAGQTRSKKLLDPGALQVNHGEISVISQHSLYNWKVRAHMENVEFSFAFIKKK